MHAPGALVGTSGTRPAARGRGAGIARRAAGRLRWTAVLLTLAAWTDPAAAQAPVCVDPALERELSVELARFEQTLTVPGPAAAGRLPVVAAELLSANSHRGEALLEVDALAGNRLYLDRLQQLGLGGVTVHVGYPLLLPQTPRSAEYLAFYRALAAEVRRRGLQLHVKTGPLFQQPEFGSVPVRYADLRVQEYLAGRAEQTLRIAHELRPDLLSFGNEPSSEQAVTGFELPPSLYVAFVRGVLARLDRRGVAVGVGAGAWDDPAYVERFARETDVDFVDLHVYPLANGWTSYLQRAVELTRLARRAGKRVVIGEAWLYKASARELRAGQAAPATSPAVFARDVFEGWSPLDQRFVRALVGFAHAERVDTVTFFWSKYLFASLPCDATSAGLAPGPRLRLADRAAAQALLEGRLSATGEALGELLRRD